ncbi:MAG: hypothetical protein QW567_03255 [Candidatus Hadarchaeales archaeon]
MDDLISVAGCAALSAVFILGLAGALDAYRECERVSRAGTLALSTAARVTTSCISGIDPRPLIRSSAGVVAGLRITFMHADGRTVSVYEEPGEGNPDASVEVPCALRLESSPTGGRMRVEVWLG